VPSGGRPLAREKLTVRLSIDPFDSGHRHVVGIDIRRSDGVVVTQVTTRSDPSLTERLGEARTLTYDIAELPLLPGSYVLHTWLLDDDTQELLDGTDQLEFDVDPQPHVDDSGLVALGGDWHAGP
jgi:hypothetical protein